MQLATDFFAVSSSSSEDDDDGDDDENDESDDGDEEGEESSESSSSSSSSSSSGAEAPEDDWERMLRGAASRRQRMTAFLNKMAAENRLLEQERASGTLGQRQINVVEGGDEQEEISIRPKEPGSDQPMIEMDLGLGVLEQKDPNSTQLSSDSDSSEAGDDSGEQEEDVMGKLLGKQRKKRNAIEELPVK
jgi:hypothetical protein